MLAVHIEGGNSIHNSIHNMRNLENSPSHEEYADVQKSQHRSSNGQPQTPALQFEGASEWCFAEVCNILNLSGLGLACNLSISQFRASDCNALQSLKLAFGIL